MVRWNDDRRAGVVESPDLLGDCWVETSALHPGAGGGLRAGQVVEVEWTEIVAGAHPVRADQVTPRDDLQATPGG